MNCTKERCRPVNVFEELDRGLHQLVDLSDEMATKVNVLFYGDVREAFVKAMAD